MSITLPIDMTARRWCVGEETGDVFEPDGDFDGITLTIEIKSPEEAREVMRAILADEARA